MATRSTADILNRLSQLQASPTGVAAVAAAATPAAATNGVAPRPVAPVVQPVSVAPKPQPQGAGVKDLTTSMLGYEQELRAFQIAALTRHHFLLLGPAGTGKSRFAREVFSQLPGIAFATQLHKFDTGESLFGIPDIKGMREENIYRYKPAGTILEADWAFLDEIFDASDVLMRRLLGVLNERKLSLGEFQHDCPLHSAIATANYSRSNEVTEAIEDRFVLKFKAKPQSNSVLIKKALAGAFKAHAGVAITEAKLKSEIATVETLPVPSDVGALLGELADTLGLTNRTAIETIKLAKAQAYLAGRRSVQVDDLSVVKYTKLDDGGRVEDLVNEMVSKVANEANERKIMGTVEARFAELKEMRHTPEALKAIREYLGSMRGYSFKDEERAKALQSFVRQLEERRTEIGRTLGLID